MNKIRLIVAFLQGKKTYILATLALLTILAEHFNRISASTEQQILWVLGFGTAAAVRAALAKLIQGDSQATQ